MREDKMLMMMIVREEEESAGMEGLYPAGKYGHVWFRLVYFRRGGY